MFDYPVVLTKDDNNTWLVTFPDVPEAVTFGETKDEALLHAVEALEATLAVYVAEGRDLPKPSAKRSRPTVEPSLIGTMKLGLYKSMREQKVRKTDLARRMKLALQQIDRLLDLDNSSRIEQIEAAYTALNKRVCVELEAA